MARISNNLLRRKILSGLVALSLSAIAPTFARAADKPIPIRIGIQAQTSWLLYTARDLKLFEKVGLEPTFIKLTTGAQSIAAMASSSLDIASPGITPFVAGLAQGVDWSVIGIDTTLPAAEGFIARKGSGIKTLEDLKGKKVGVARGSTSYYGLLAALDSKGIGKDDVKLLLLGPTEQMGAMGSGDVDAVAVWEPWLQRQKQANQAHLIGMEADYGIHTALAVYAARDAFSSKNPEAVEKFLEGLLLAYQHIKKNGPEVAVAAVANAMGVSKELAKIMYDQAPMPEVVQWANSEYQYSIIPGSPFPVEAQKMTDFLFAEQIINDKVDLSKKFDSGPITRVLERSDG